MGSVHQFAIISKKSDENIISSNMESVSISDVIIQYIGDSLKWVNATWNGKRIISSFPGKILFNRRFFA